MRYIMAIDQGTSSSRVVIYDPLGQQLGAVQHEVDTTFPQDGWVEQDPEVLWFTTLSAGREVLARLSLTGADIAAIGITNQRETTLVWDRETGKCLHNAIVWQDRRTAAQCAQMRAEGMEQFVATTTGLVIDPYFSGSKLAWLLREVPAVRKANGRACFGTVDSYLIWRLTNGRSHVTDATNASRTMLFDISRQCWQQTLLDYFAIPREMLPEVLDSNAEFGSADPQWFGASIPIMGVAGDQQAALIGQACFTPGMAKSTYGTGCFTMINTGDRQLTSAQQLLTTVAYRINGKTTFALEGSIFSAGVAVKWLRDQLGLVTSAAETEAAARRTGGDTGGVYLVPAFTGLGAPHWAASARGLLTGLTLATNRDHLITATLASVAYQSAELVAAMAGDGAVLQRLRVDGGMVVNDWLCQFLADMMALPVERPVNTETTALGAAILASLGIGLLDNLAAAQNMWCLDREFVPSMPAAQRKRLLTGWNQAVRRTLLQ